MVEIKLDNGWIVSKSESKPAVLHVTPLKNSIFRKKLDILLPDEVYNTIDQGEVEIKSLFKNYKLHNLIFQWEEREPRIISKPENTEDVFYGKDFVAEKCDSGYYLIYELSRHGGGNRKIPISESIYIETRTNEYSLMDLFDKYNLHHLDVPENDL